jgi:hypothetical protein
VVETFENKAKKAVRKEDKICIIAENRPACEKIVSWKTGKSYSRIFKSA